MSEQPTNYNFDPINPSYYKQGGIECIDAMEASSTREEFEGHLRLTAQKYIWRLKHKDDPIKNIDKAIWYLNRLKKSIENANQDTTF